MNILYILIPIGLVLVVLGIWAFFWAVGSGQFDDLETPGWSVLVEQDPKRPADEARQPEEREP